MKAQDNNKSQQQVGRTLELNKRATDFCFDKFIARFIVKFFFLFSKKKRSHIAKIYMILIASASSIVPNKSSQVDFKL